MKETAKEETRRMRRRRGSLLSGVSPFQLLSSALFAVALVVAGGVASPHAHAQRKKPVTRASRPATAAASASAKAKPSAVVAKSITLKTEPKAVVWLDEVRRGVTDESGQFEIAKVSPGRHTLRVRAAGFGERTLSLLPTERGIVSVKLTRTTDAAELAFQQAEEARERAANDEARREAAEFYRRALTLRPRYAAAHVGLARVLLDLNDYDGALDEVEEARRSRPGLAEASAVEGRILRASSQNAEAVVAYLRAIREARGFQPEAHTGLGIIYEEEGKYEEAATAFRKAVAQLSDTEPVLYELLGRVYERLEKYEEAVAAYEKYLALAPQGKLAPAIESVIEQLRKQAAEQSTPRANQD